jgi:hypothetical protein
MREVKMPNYWVDLNIKYRVFIDGKNKKEAEEEVFQMYCDDSLIEFVGEPMKDDFYVTHSCNVNAVRAKP